MVLPFFWYVCGSVCMCALLLPWELVLLAIGLMIFLLYCRSELNRLNFQGFYTVVLERDDDLITVATVRYDYIFALTCIFYLA